MSINSLENMIINRMKLEPEGTIFTCNDFFDLSNYDAIKMALCRLHSDEKIFRLLNGYYTIPYYSKLINEYGLPSVNELALKIADRYSWNIIPSGDTALNLVGLSTQIPNTYEYISDGPYRKINYLKHTINFRHTSNRMISKYSRPLCLVIESIKALKNLTETDILILARYCKNNVEEDIVLDTKSVSAWIHKLLKQINEVTIYENE